MSLLYSGDSSGINNNNELLCNINGSLSSSLECADETHSDDVCYFSTNNNFSLLDLNISDIIIIEDPRIEILRRYSYGVALPLISVFGIVGNIFNLIVLTRKNMRGTAYIYMRGYSAAALLAIIFALPFAWRVLIHREQGHWNNLIPAYYFAYLELFLGNGCLGIGVLMLLALTLERYISVCHPSQTRPILGSPCRAVIIIPILTFILYIPEMFRSYLKICRLKSTDEPSSSSIIYQRTENTEYNNHPAYGVYKILLELIFKVIPVILLAALNLRILIVYRKSCQKRRKMTLRVAGNGEEDPKKYAEERRLFLLLGSTSFLFLTCVTPMLILNVTLSDKNLAKYPYQVFRAIANLLEITNYSITFYIYCLFSEDFRNTLLNTLNINKEVVVLPSGIIGACSHHHHLPVDGRIKTPVTTTTTQKSI